MNAKQYKNGQDFIQENSYYLNQNKYMSSLFYLDSKVLKESNSKNYAVRVENRKRVLLGMKVEPFNLLLYGDACCTIKLLKYLDDNDLEYGDVMCSTSIGEELLKSNRYSIDIAMDFMECSDKTLDSSIDVIKAMPSDIDEIYGLTIDFIKDCGLSDTPNKDKLSKAVERFRLIKEDNKIISMAAYSIDTDTSYKITYVYTKPEYRGKGYAKKIVNVIKNEIIDGGKTATLNVDKKNPISNQLYESLGFKKIFSQGIYKKNM